MNINLFAALAALFNAVITMASALNRTAQIADNVAKLGEKRTQEWCDEQDKLSAKRLADLDTKVDKKYEQEVKTWSNL